MKAVAKHETHYLFALCAKRDANADFGGALGDDEGEDSEQTHRGEQKRYHRKGEQQSGIEAGVDGGLAEDLVHGEDVGDGQVGIDGGNRVLNRKRKAGRGLLPREQPEFRNVPTLNRRGNKIVG